MSKNKIKIIENYAYEEKEHLIEIEEKQCLDSRANTKFVWLSLSPPKTSILSSKHCLYFQLSVVCVLLLFCLCFVLLIFGELSHNSQQSINRLIDRFTDTASSDDTNQTDIFDTTILKTKLRHGSIRVITHCGTLFGGKEYEAFVFKVSQPKLRKLFSIKMIEWFNQKPLKTDEKLLYSCVERGLTRAQIRSIQAIPLLLIRPVLNKPGHQLIDKLELHKSLYL